MCDCSAGYYRHRRLPEAYKRCGGYHTPVQAVDDDQQFNVPVAISIEYSTRGNIRSVTSTSVFDSEDSDSQH